MTPRNYFFPIAPSVQLTEDLSGALVYVDNQLGAKSTNDPITGIFLFRTSHTDFPDISSDAYMVEEYTLYEAWWHRDLPFDAPFETKLKTYLETGALWLDNSMLSEYLLLYVSHPDTWHRWHYHEHIDSYFDNHSGRQILALTQAYQAYSVCSNPCTNMLVSYMVSAFPQGLYHSMLEQMKMRVNHLYERELQPLYGHITERILSYGIALLERRHNTWYECMAEPELYGSSLESKPTPWTKYSIHQVILAYMLASYWMQHADIERQEVFPEELADMQISVTLRKELWEVYYRLHRVRLFDQLNLEDSRSEQPTDAEIKLALATEEQSRTSMPDLSPWSLNPHSVEIISTRISTYASQFYQYLGYTPQPEDGNQPDRYKQAVLAMVNLKDEQGKPLIHFHNDWYPVFVVLAEHHLFACNQFREGAAYFKAILGDKAPTESALSKASANIVLSTNSLEWKSVPGLRPTRFAKICLIRDTFRKLLA